MASIPAIPAILPFGVGPTELIVILVIVLVIFGPKKLPELSKAVGLSMKELKKASEGKEEAKEEKAADQS